MYFTLAVSAATAARCAALADAARGADPRVMPIPGPARVAWRAPDERAAVLHWGDPGYAGTIWAEGAAVLGLLCPELLDLPLAGTPWRGETRTPATVVTAPPGPATADWRRDLGAVAGFLRGYVLDHGEASPLFGIVSRRAAERCVAPPQADPQAAWALATLAALLSGDWLSAREPSARTASRGRA